MTRWKHINSIRAKLRNGRASVGSWMQIPSSEIAEIMGDAGYDWVAIDLEHGSIGIQQMPDLCRALELGGTLPLARVAEGNPKECKDVLDAGAGGVIIPMVENGEQVERVRRSCCWPPVGNRGVGYSRANLFGKNFDNYLNESRAPILVAQIEHIRAVEGIHNILSSKGLDAVFVGPYDLSASMGLTGDLQHPDVVNALNTVVESCKKYDVPAGIHVVSPDVSQLSQSLDRGYRFIAFSIDAVFLHTSSAVPDLNLPK